MAENQGDWRSEAFRRKVIQQIDEAVRSANTPMPKPSVEMENHVYQKAKTREEYLALVARLILHVKDFNVKLSKIKQEPGSKIKQEPSLKIKQEPGLEIKQEPGFVIKQEPGLEIKQEPGSSSSIATASSSSCGSSNLPSNPIMISGKRKLPQSKVQKINLNVAKYLIKDMQPFSTVSSTAFRELLNECEPRYKLPCRSTFSETVVPKIKSVVVQRIKEDIATCGGVSWTTDSWTSSATESYITITAHYCKDFHLESAVLQTTLLPLSHTGENIGQVLKEAAAEWKCVPLCLTTDNALNMTIAAKVAEVPIHLGCFADTLNLASSRAVAVPAVHNVLAKMRSVVSLFHRNTTAASLLKKKQELLKLPPHKLLIDVKTRWNSSYLMVERYIEQQAAILAAFTDGKLNESLKTSIGVASPVNYLDNQRRGENKMMQKVPNQQMQAGGVMAQGGGIQDPINALQNMAMSGGSIGPAQPGMMGPGQPVPQMAQQMRHPMAQQMPPQPQQQQQPRMPGQQQPRPHLQRQDAFIVTSSQNIQQAPVIHQANQGPQSSPLGYGSGGLGGMMRHSPFSSLSGQGNQASPLVNSNPPSQGAIPSPAQQGQLAGSPIHMMTSPSPQIVPSPVSRAPTGAPSPSAALNTPGNPNTQGAIPSPASQSAEEHAYLEKLKQLSKYIDPLRRMIKKTEDGNSGKESDHRQNDINKLKNLHDILTNPAKRVPMATLMKCEQVLEKIQFGAKAPPHTPQVHMCQPLLDSVAAHITSPMINHILHNTFGPAMSAMFGSPIRAPSPPPKRRKIEEKSRIPDILQGEIARLDRRFKVKMDPLQHPGSKDVHLVCKLDDHYLPSVPPILVTIPYDYPDNSPECSTIRKDYEATPFLRSIQKALVTHLLALPSKFTFTSMLDMWEMSVRKACCNT